MKNILIQIVATIFLMTTSAAEAKLGVTGSDLYKSCELFANAEKAPKDIFEATDLGVCFATVETIMYFKQTLGLCIPQRVTLVQGIKVTLKFMDNHPNLLHMPLRAIAFVALKDAFPCEKQ